MLFNNDFTNYAQRNMRNTFFAAALVLPQIVGTAAVAGDDPLRYHKAGLSTDVWRVSDSTFAPWITDFTNQPKDTTEIKPGSSVIVFRTNRMEAPAPLACNAPKYELKSIAAGRLFGGRLTDPTQDAKDLGLDPNDIVVLDTGCGATVYFIDPYKAVFVIADRLYTIERNPPPGGRLDDRERVETCMKLVADNRKARGPAPESFLSETPSTTGRLDGASSEARFQMAHRRDRISLHRQARRRWQPNSLLRSGTCVLG